MTYPFKKLKTLTHYTIEDFKIDQDAFNEISGQAFKTTKQDIENQLKLIYEEVGETREAIRDNDVVGTLDGLADTLYVTLGALQKLSNLGVDVNGAMRQVAEDNLSKFTDEEEIANNSMQDYFEKGTKVRTEYNSKYRVFVIKDESDKVRKPLDFVSTDLSNYVPNGLVFV